MDHDRNIVVQMDPNLVKYTWTNLKAQTQNIAKLDIDKFTPEESL